MVTQSTLLAVVASLVALSATLYTHLDALHLLLPMSAGAGFGYLMTSFFLAHYKPTRYVGDLLLSRIHFLVYNWANHFVRSYWEVSSWCVTISALYRASGSLWLSVLLGSISGVLLVLLSDVFSEVPFYETFEGSSRRDGKSVSAAVSAKALTSARPSSTFSWNTVLLVYGLSQVQFGLLLLSERYSNLLIVALLIALGSLCMMVTADALVSWEVSKAAGRVLQQRIAQAGPNWRRHPVRSALETLAWLGALLGCFYWSAGSASLGRRVLVSLQAGVVLGTAALLLSQDLGRWFYRPTCPEDAVTAEQRARGLVSLAEPETSPMSSDAEAEELEPVLRKRASGAAEKKKQKSESGSLAERTQRESGKLSESGASQSVSALQKGETECESVESAGESAEPPCLAEPLRLRLADYAGKEHPLLQELDALREGRFASLPRYTMKEVARHASTEDMWLVVRGLVLDMTQWAPHHPGGLITLERFAGGDATDELLQFHPDWVLRQRMLGFVVGTVSDAPEATPVQRDFRALHRELARRGYFLPRPGFYLRKLLVLGVMLCASLACVLCFDSFAWRMLGAVLLAMFWQQIAFIGHDAGHMAVSYDRVWDYQLGYFIANLTTGIGVGWWKATHNVHHAVPNSLFDDPDIAHLPVLAISPRFFESLWNTYHKRVMPFDWLARNLFVPYQHYLYYPIMAFARFNLYLQVIIWLVKSPAKYNPFRRTELLCLGVFWAWYLALLFQIPSAGQRWAFLLVSHWVSGLLEVQITLSHFSMPVVEGDPENKGKNLGLHSYGGDFYTRNIAASLDVDCPAGLDWFHGGLHFQCIHHCFPRVNRANLRHLKPVFQELCRAHGIEYKELPFVEANKDIIRTLRFAAEQTKTWSPLIKESFDAHG